MAEEPTPTPTNSGASKWIVKAIILSGWAMSMLTVVGIIAVALYVLASGQDLQPALKEWAGISLGYVFGSIFSLVKNYLPE